MTNDKFQMTKMGIIGAGNMGEALIKGLVETQNFASLPFVSDISRQRLRSLQKKYRISTAASNVELVKRSDIIILAVKPQKIDDVLKEIKTFLNNKKLIISIAAGITTNCIEKALGAKTAVVRAMPNMPALIAKGISAVCPGRYAKPADIKTAINILSAIGKVVEVEEEFMDAVTAISGSGPAYFFFLMEILTDIGKKYGLSEKVANELAVQTAFGAGSLALETKQDPLVLRQRVASKGGTTEAAFKVLEHAGIRQIFEEAAGAAVKRARGLCS